MNQYVLAVESPLSKSTLNKGCDRTAMAKLRNYFEVYRALNERRRRMLNARRRESS